MVEETDPQVEQTEEPTATDANPEGQTSGEALLNDEATAAQSLTNEQPTASLPPIDSDPLPEWEELTPELFEDECLRGDFMLRWATILLAMLLGAVYITESTVLVQVRTGQYLAENGLLPPRTDPFAIATDGAAWVNFHWLSDLIIGTTQSLGGFSALTLLTALKLGLCFWLISKIGYEKISHWWGAICSAVAAVAVFPAVQAGEMSVTILGFSVLLYLLDQWREKPGSSLLWGIPILFAFWTNMDSRAWAGLGYFAIYLILDVITRKPTKQQIIIGISALAAGILISPWPGQPVFGYQHALANAAQAQTEGLSGELFPRYAYGMTTPEFWRTPDVFPIAAAVLLGFSFFAMFLNASRLDWSLTLAWVALNTLSLLLGEFIPYAAIVNCVVATLQGQDWYRHRFKNDYSIGSFSVFYARAGRAVTVISFFLIAYATINGLLMGPQGRRVGLGLDPRLKNRLESTEHKLLAGIYGENLFNVRADQGDMLIWFGKKPYIDSRNGLFINGDTNFAEKHRALRASLFSQGPLAGIADEGIAEISWQDEFKKLEINSVIVRLWGEKPAYSPFLQLIASREWPMTGLGAAGAVFTRGEIQDKKFVEHLKEHNVTDFALQAFRIEKDKNKQINETVPSWPQPVSNYDRWLVQKLDVTPNKIQLARHYNVIAIRLQELLQIDQVMALATLANRSASDGLNSAPDNPDAYRVLTDAQALLQKSEQSFTAINGQNYSLQFRSQLALCQTFQAATASGQAPEDLRRLFAALLAQQSLDTAQEVAQQYYEKVHRSIMLNPESDEAEIEQAEKALTEIDSHIEQVKSEVEKARVNEIPIPQLAGIALNGRCPTLAVSILEEDKTLIAKNPQLQLMYASLLLTNGRIEKAWEQLEAMQPVMEQVAVQAPPLYEQWKVSTSLANLAANVRTRPALLFDEIADSQNLQNMKALLFHPPASANPGPSFDIWSGLTLRTHNIALTVFPEKWANAKLQRALILIDQGDLEAAKLTLDEIQAGHPEYSMRSLVVLYLALLTGNKYEIEPPSAWIPIWGEMFAPDEETEEAPLIEIKPSTPEMKPEQTAKPREKTTSAGNRPPSPELPEPIKAED